MTEQTANSTSPSENLDGAAPEPGDAGTDAGTEVRPGSTRDPEPTDSSVSIDAAGGTDASAPREVVAEPGDQAGGTEPATDLEGQDDVTSSAAEGEGAPAGRRSRHDRLEQEGEIAADYLEELLEITDLDGDLDMDVEGDRATVSIVGAHLPELVGDDGEVLEALQELTRLAVYRETGERSRLMLDVSGHRAERRTELERQAAEVVARVQESGEREQLTPMSPFERKVVHDVVAASGLSSESEGTEPRRYVVVLPA